MDTAADALKTHITTEYFGKKMATPAFMSWVDACLERAAVRGLAPEILGIVAGDFFYPREAAEAVESLYVT